MVKRFYNKKIQKFIRTAGSAIITFIQLKVHFGNTAANKACTTKASARKITSENSRYHKMLEKHVSPFRLKAIEIAISYLDILSDP